MTSGLLERLTSIVGQQGIVRSAFDMAPFLEDWRGAEKGTAHCVVLPQNTVEVSRVIRLANERRISVYVQGGNTGLCYGAVPAQNGNCIILALSRMKTIRSVDRAANCIVVEAGTVLDTVHQAASDIDKSFPMHLGSEGTAQIGGLIATNAGGTNALRYGTMRDLVYGLEFVLPDGRVISELEPLRKNNVGYDLKHLQIGGEGTLGVVTAASLKLFPALKSDAHAWLAFDDPADAVTLFSRLQDQFDNAIIACELLSQSQVDLVLKHIPRTRIPFDRTPAWTVMIELGAPDPAANLKPDLEAFLAAQLEARKLLDAVVAQNSNQAQDFWHVRHSVSEANKTEGRGHTHDIAVSVTQVPHFLKAGEAILADHFPQSSQVITCHLGDGNIHYIAMYSHSDWDGIADKSSLIEDLQRRIHDLATASGGTFSAEHGIGRKLTRELTRLTDPSRYDILCRIKSAIDPNNTLNPGILLDSSNGIKSADLTSSAMTEI